MLAPVGQWLRCGSWPCASRANSILRLLCARLRLAVYWAFTLFIHISQSSHASCRIKIQHSSQNKRFESSARNFYVLPQSPPRSFWALRTFRLCGQMLCPRHQASILQMESSMIASMWKLLNTCLVAISVYILKATEPTSANRPSPAPPTLTDRSSTSSSF